MNYEPNTTEWQVGDIVIHDADAKNIKYLMRVTKIDRPDGLIETVYINHDEDQIYENDAKFLHDPVRFGLNDTWEWDK